MPLVEMARLPTLIVDIAAWGMIHAGSGYLAHRLNDSHFDHDNWLFRGRAWERNGRLYESLRVKRWKDRVPEAGAVFAGGVSKRTLTSRDPAGLVRLSTETRRAEFAHWACAVASPVFAIWNSPGISMVMVLYGVLVNAPFVVIQRYNRLRATRSLVRRSITS